MTTEDLPDHVQRNRAEWDVKAAQYAEWAPDAWGREEITWGTVTVPEADLHALPDNLDGLDAIELGCGTAYFSAWLARRGAKPVGIDNSPKQLETARRMQEQYGLHFRLHLGNAEDVPYPDASFDLALSEYGASIWCDPYAWIPEAARLLRPGGRLVYLVNGILAMLTTGPDFTEDMPVTTCFERPYFGMHRFEWPDDDSVEFHLPHGEMIRLLRDCGFELERLLELQPAHDNDLEALMVPNWWAKQWPAEEIWVARKH
jgi:SAM-dependent methyltransferase